MLNPTFLCVFFVLLCARFLEPGFEAGTVTTTAFSFVLAVGELLLTCDPLVAGTDWKSSKKFSFSLSSELNSSHFCAVTHVRS